MSDPILVVCPHCQKRNRLPAARLEERPACGSGGKALFTGAPVEVDSGGFEAHQRGDLPVLTDVWATWCGPCRTMAPHYAAAAKALEPRLRLLKLEIDGAPDIARRYGIQSVPTLLLMRRGQVLAQTAGAMDATRLAAWVRSHLHNERV
jgi:thioredoxin 2